jgi:hypothetical protein
MARPFFCLRAPILLTVEKFNASLQISTIPRSAGRVHRSDRPSNWLYLRELKDFDARKSMWPADCNYSFVRARPRFLNLEKRRLTAMANAPVKAIKKGKKLGAVKPLMSQRPLSSIRPLTRVQ